MNGDGTIYVLVTCGGFVDILIALKILFFNLVK